MESLRKVTVVVILGVFILGAVFSSSLIGCKKEDETMGATSGIPAIDSSASVRTETATFALG